MSQLVLQLHAFAVLLLLPAACCCCLLLLAAAAAVPAAALQVWCCFIGADKHCFQSMEGLCNVQHQCKGGGIRPLLLVLMLLLLLLPLLL